MVKLENLAEALSKLTFRNVVDVAGLNKEEAETIVKIYSNDKTYEVFSDKDKDQTYYVAIRLAGEKSNA